MVQKSAPANARALSRYPGFVALPVLCRTLRRFLCLLTLALRTARDGDPGGLFDHGSVLTGDRCGHREALTTEAPVRLRRQVRRESRVGSLGEHQVECADWSVGHCPEGAGCDVFLVLRVPVGD